VIPEEVAEDPEQHMIHANKIMNQKMDPTTLQKSMSHSFIYAVRTAQARGCR
jgi:hypothetical protein